MKNQARKPLSFGNGFIILMTFIIVLAPMLVFRIMSRNIVSEITETISLQHSQELNAQMTSTIANSLNAYYKELNTEYSALRLVDALDEEKLTAFIAEVEQNNEISYLAFADEEGTVYESSGSYLGTMRITLLGGLLNGKERAMSDNETVGDENYILIGTSFEKPIAMGNQRICCAILGMTSEDLAKAVVLQSNYSGGYSSIISEDGHYVIKNQEEPYSGLNVFSILSKDYGIDDYEISVLKRAFEKEQSYLLRADATENRQAVYLYFAPIDNTEWYAVNILPASFVGNSIADLQDALMTLFIVIITLLLIVAAVVSVSRSSVNRKLRESQVELEKALKLAEDASNAKTAFLFNMSHDIRTPMNAILGFTDIGLTHAGDSERAVESFRKIKTSGTHLLNLINDILEMSRIEAGKLSMQDEELNIYDAIDGVNTMSQALALPKSIDFQTEIGEISNPYIYADELHVNEIIINLISNAVKYTPDGGKVRYSIEQLGEAEDGKVNFRFTVSDNGIGMSEEFQEHLFEAFSREESATVSKVEGAGLGLSIVKKIVDIAGGKISVESEPRKGSVFTLELPFRVMEEEAVEKFKEDHQFSGVLSTAVALDGKKVLLVEDNEINREIATMILEDANMNVETAEDGAIAVDTLKEKGMDYYDVVLMDIQMPVMDGYEATKVIRNLPGGDTVRIIALSANAFEEDKQKSLAVGMNAHVAKPIDIQELMETISRLAR